MANSKIIVSGNWSRLSTLLTGLGDKKSVQKAVARSIKRTLTSVRKVAAQEIRSKKLIKLTSAEAKQKVHSYDESSGGKPVAEQYGKIWFGSKAESLGRFYARRIARGRSSVIMGQDKYGGWRGVRLYGVKVNQYGAPYLKNPDRSFLVAGKRGPVVFERLAGSKRLPIEKVKGPGLAELVEQTGIIRRVQSVAKDRYEKEFAVNAKFYAEQALKRAKTGK